MRVSDKRLYLREEDDGVSAGGSPGEGSVGYVPSGLYHGPNAVLTACISRLMLCTKPSSASTLAFRMSFVSVRVDSLALLTVKNSLMDSYGQDGV